LFLSLQFSCSLLLLLFENQERQFKRSMQNIVLSNKVVVLRLRVRTIAKEITAQKQVATTRESLVA